MNDPITSLKGIIVATRPTPDGGCDYKDHAAAWSAAINAAIWQAPKGLIRTRLAREARKRGLLDGADAPRAFRKGIESLCG